MIKKPVAIFLLLICSIFSAHAGNGEVAATRFYENAQSPVLIPLINSTKKSIKIEIYQMDDFDVRMSLRAALKRGVRVDIIKEPTPIGGACRVFDAESSVSPSPADCLDQKKFMHEVRRAGGSYVPFNKALCVAGTKCLEHGKLAIFDNSIALMSTGNFDSTNLCPRGGKNSTCNRDYSITTTNAAYVGALVEIFMRDQHGVPYNPNDVLKKFKVMNLTVSPNSFAPLKRFILSAKKSIQLQNQYIKDPELIEVLKQAAEKGVHIEMTTMSFCYFSVPSQSDIENVTRIYTDLENSGIKTRQFTKRIRIGGKPGYLHAKSIVVDGKWAWVGSVNGSTQSLNENREFGLIFPDVAGVAQLSKIMTQDFYDQGTESWQESIRCKKDHISEGY